MVAIVCVQCRRRGRKRWRLPTMTWCCTTAVGRRPDCTTGITGASQHRPTCLANSSSCSNSNSTTSSCNISYCIILPSSSISSPADPDITTSVITHCRLLRCCYITAAGNTNTTTLNPSYIRVSGMWKRPLHCIKTTNSFNAATTTTTTTTTCLPLILTTTRWRNHYFYILKNKIAPRLV